MNALWTPMLWAMFAMAPLGDAPVSPEDAATAVEGSYKIVSSEKNGQPTPKEEIDGMVVTFTKDKILTIDRDKKEVYSATYKIDSTQKPAMITMVSTMEQFKGATAKGLVEIGKDKVKLIYTLPDGKIMPTEFKTFEGQVMVLLERLDPTRTAADGLPERR
jgi:uncharacterized protein (TIGR03067 family)